MILSSIFPSFVTYSPRLISGWISKGMSGTPVTADEHNAGVVMISLQRDVIANQASMAAPGGLRIPSVQHEGQNIAATGWSDRVMPDPADNETTARQRRQIFEAATYSLQQLARTAQLVPATTPAGEISVSRDGLYSGDDRTMALFGLAQDAAILPQDARNRMVLENRDLMNAISGSFGNLASGQMGIAAQSTVRSSVQALANAYEFLSDQGNRNAAIAAGVLIAGVIGVRMLLK